MGGLQLTYITTMANELHSKCMLKKLHISYILKGSLKNIHSEREWIGVGCKQVYEIDPQAEILEPTFRSRFRLRFFWKRFDTK